MANFTTHIAVGTVVAGMMSTLVMAANIAPPEQLITLTAAGALGSVLPDVDLKDSRPSQAIFSSLAVLVAFAVLFNVAWRYSIAEMWILWFLIFLGVRYGVCAIFHQFSYHRGIYHSILAAVFFAFFTAAVYRHVFGADEPLAWLAGIFMLVGYLVHLTLDEIYSVDVMDARVKSSFGTALKLYDSRHLGHSGAMAVATVLAFLVAPPFIPSWKALTTPELRAGIQDRLLPKDKWFGFIAEKMEALGRTMPAGMGARRITTGSVRTEAVTPAPTEQTSR
jgi:hypothetical protein